MGTSRLANPHHGSREYRYGGWSSSRKTRFWEVRTGESEVNTQSIRENTVLG